MIVDFHQHPYPGVHELMQQNHVTACVLLPGPGGNETVLQWARHWPGQFIPFYWVDLADPPKAAAQLEVAVKQHGHRGIKFQPLVQRFYPNEPRLRPIFAKASQLGIPVLFHSGVVAFASHYAQYGTCIYIDELASEFPDLKIVIAHMGGNYHYQALILAEKHENVYLDTAFLPFFCRRMLPPIAPEALIAHAAHIAGAQKVLYGSEGLWPQAVLVADLTEQEKSLILGGNALRLLGIERTSAS